MNALLSLSLAVSAALLPTLASHAAIPPDLALVPVATGLNKPVAIAHAGDGSGRLFVAEIAGRVRVIRNGSVLTTPLIDVSALTSTSNCGGECGLLGLAFAPNFASSRHVYTLHNDPQSNNVILRHTVPLGSDVSDPALRQTVMTIGSGSGQHNGGDLKFGPDGMLYITVGDAAGGGAPAQLLSSLRGKILRIDVANLPYSIPSGNPYASDPPGANTRDEIWHVGLRNPWRFSFDRNNGDMWIADVAGNGGTYEEINRAAAATSGVNFGWNCYGGTTQLNCSLAMHTPPVIQVTTSTLGCAIVGGFVFNGPVAMLKGTYFYGDYCSADIWTANAASPGSPQLSLSNGMLLTTFGEDEAGWIYIAEDLPSARILRISSERIFANGLQTRPSATRPALRSCLVEAARRARGTQRTQRKSQERTQKGSRNIRRRRRYPLPCPPFTLPSSASLCELCASALRSVS